MEEQGQGLFKYGRRAIETIRYDGPRPMLSRALKFALLPLGTLSMSHFCRMDLTRPLEKVKAKIPVEVGQATEADMEELSTRYQTDYEPGFTLTTVQEIIKRNFSENAKCFVARIDRRIVHSNWVYFEPREANGCMFRPAKAEAMCNNGATAREWRGRGIHAEINNEMLLFLKRSGYMKAYTCVSTDNISSQKGLVRVGWDFFGVFLCFSPHRSGKQWGWVVRGPLDPFVPVGKPGARLLPRLYTS